MSLHIGDRNREDLVECTDITRSQNDSYRVTVREMIGGYRSWVGGKRAAQARMRRLARRLFSNAPGTTTETLNEFRDRDGSEFVTYLVNGPGYNRT